MVSTKTMSTSRLSRCATEPKIARGDLAQRVEQEVHRPIRRVVGKPATAGDRDPLGHPPCGGQLAARFQRPLCHQREQHPLGRRGVQAPVRGDPVQRRADAEPLPELVEQPRAAEAARVQDLDLAGECGRDRLLRVEEPGDRGDQPGQRVAVHRLGAAEVVDHLRRGHPGDRVAFAVRQLQIRHRRPVPVAPLRLPQVHPYTVSTYSLVKSSDTPEIVCLQEFADSMTLQASYQHNRSALPRNVPTNCGSRVRASERAFRRCANSCGIAQMSPIVTGQVSGESTAITIRCATSDQTNGRTQIASSPGLSNQHRAVGSVPECLQGNLLTFYRHPNDLRELLRSIALDVVICGWHDPSSGFARACP